MSCLICLSARFSFKHQNLYCNGCMNYLCGSCIDHCKVTLSYVGSVSHYFYDSIFGHMNRCWICSEKCGVEYSIKKNINVKPIKDIQQKRWTNIIIDQSLNDVLINDLIKIIQSY